MHVRPKWVKDILSVACTFYYLVAAEQADEKVRKIRGALTLEHLRVSWNKPLTPYLSVISRLLRPKLTKYKYPPLELRIARPKRSSYKEPVKAWLYFDGPLSSLKKHDKIILDVPGGGYVAMTPRCHDDKLIGWAGRTGLPVLALDYKKAPEHPYPYALNECYDVYESLVTSRGQCIGLSGQFVPKIVVSGDSAGGNLAVGMVLMIIQAGSTDNRKWRGENSLPVPDGLVLIYPSLDMNIGNWMTDEQMALIKDRRTRKTNRGVIRRKSDDYRKLAPDTPINSDDENEHDSIRKENQGKQLPKTTDAHVSAAHTFDVAAVALSDTKPFHLKTRLAMSSMISYFNDRILTPEMMRAMIILYIGPHSRPDFATEFLLSPLLAPETLLVDFPKTYFLTGERDPLVDDTVIFAGRLRQAKLARFEERKELGLISSSERFEETDWVNVMLVPGISHGFLQFVSVFPEGWKYIFRCARWMADIFREIDTRALKDEETQKEKRKQGHHSSNSMVKALDNTITENVIEEGEGHDNPDGDADNTPRALSINNLHMNDSVDNVQYRNHRRTRTGSSGDEDRPLEMSAIRPAVSSLPLRLTPSSPTIDNSIPSSNSSNPQSSSRHAKPSIQIPPPNAKTGKPPRITTPISQSDQHLQRPRAASVRHNSSTYLLPRINNTNDSNLVSSSPSPLATTFDLEEYGDHPDMMLGPESLLGIDMSMNYTSSQSSSHKSNSRKDHIRDDKSSNDTTGSIRNKKYKNSIAALASSDDLLGRRMEGYTGSLMGVAPFTLLTPTTSNNQ